jgi:hypothetical protein
MNAPPPCTSTTQHTGAHDDTTRGNCMMMGRLIWVGDHIAMWLFMNMRWRGTDAGPQGHYLEFSPCNFSIVINITIEPDPLSHC